VHLYARPQDTAAFSADIRRLVGRLDPQLIVPTCEEVFHLSAAAPGLGLGDRLAAPPLSVLAELHAKSRFAALCARLGLDAPETWRVDTPEGLEPFTATAGELVFKPEYSRFGAETLVRPSADAVRRLSPAPDRAWTVQRHVAGEEVCFYAACHDGQLTVFCAYAPTRRLKRGAGYAFQAAPRAAAVVLEAAATTLAPLVGRGQFACDAIVDADGRAWLIECNPRATSGVHLFGRNPALATALAGAGGMARPADERPRRLGPAMWFVGLPEAARSGRLRRWTSDLRSGRDVVGAPGDRLPVLGALLDSAGFAIAALAGGRTTTQQTTMGIEWNGEAI
jgi:hypothetical protein